MDSEQRQTLLGREYEEAENVEQLMEELAAPLTYDDDASRELRKRLWWREAMINSVFIALWFGFATLLSMYNKWMFSPTYYNFPFPLFVTSTHMIVQFILSSTVRSIWPHIFKPPGHPTVKEYVQKCVPCAVTTGLDIGLSNLSLKTITLSLYTMCKSSSLIFVLIFAFIFRLEKFSIRLVSVILLIAGGVLLMVLSTDVEGHGGPPTDSSLAHTIRAFAATSAMAAPLVVGIMLVFTASACGGLRWALTQLLLTGAHGHGQSSASSITSDEAHSERHHSMGLANPAATIYFLSPSMFVTIFLVSSVVEGPLPTRLAESGFFDNFAIAIKTIGFILFPGLLAFSMVLSEYYVIQRTGIVPMSIAGIFKEVTTILLATLFFHDDMTFVNWIGLFITVCGIAIFTYHKYQKSVESIPGPLDSEVSEGEIALPTCHEDGPEPGSGVEASRRRSSEDMHWPSPKAARTRSSLDSHEMDATIAESAKLLDPSNETKGEKPSSPTQLSGHNVWLAASTSPGSSKAGKDKDPRKVRFSIAGVGAHLPTVSDSDDLLDSRSSSSLPNNSFARPT